MKKSVASDSTLGFSPNWRNIGFVIPIHLVGLIAYPLYVFLGGGFAWVDLAIFCGMYIFSAFGICVAYHRGFTHRSFTMTKPLKIFSTLAGASAAEGSALSWCSDHRRHHIYEDTPKDPYNVNRSFWWAHMGWMLGSPTTTDFSNVRDLERDPIVKHQHDHYGIYFLATCFILPTIIGAFFDRAWAGLLCGGFTRVFLVNQGTYMINSWAHYFGTQPFSRESTARDSLFLSFVAFGEGWHNYHHRFPFDYRNGPKATQWDPSKWMIYGLSKMGLASNLKVTPEMEILKARMETSKLDLKVETPMMKELEEKLIAAYRNWNQAYLHWNEKRAAFVDRRSVEWQNAWKSLQEARLEFKDLYGRWSLELAAAAA